MADLVDLVARTNSHALRLAGSERLGKESDGGGRPRARNDSHASIKGARDEIGAFLSDRSVGPARSSWRHSATRTGRAWNGHPAPSLHEGERLRGHLLGALRGTFAPRESSGRYSIIAMSWGEVELEPEVRDWYLALDEGERARVGFHVDRLAEMGPLLDEPFTKQLDGKLRELRFFLRGRATRITYWIASNRRIILLTVFVKTRQRERREVERARRAYQQCVAERHTAEEN